MEKVIDRENPQKLYLQLYGILKNKIESGEWPVESQIPTEDELCKTYEVSKATVRLAVSDLARQGYLKRRQGKGTFVCKRIISEGLSMVSSFKELMLDAGVVSSTKVLAQTMMMPSDDLDIKLDVAEDKHIIYIKRLRLVDNEPVLFQETYIPYHVCPSLLEEDLEKNSLLALMEKKCGVRITKVQDYIGMNYLEADECKLLGFPDSCAALILEQLFYSGETQICYTRSIKRPDRFRFFIEFERKG